ncbi:unnamed protein product [Paramecium sonneborni]|uniref:Transmembrane protein n=1 Tax=Paramecium sonneborni TaxID=65129 RepID=A0A8S1R0V1_9CILI|nr:unnamed protein product [Paramecium sonneborni]
MIIIDFLYILGICCATVAECLFEQQNDYELYSMIASLPILCIWCVLRIKYRREKNDQISMLVLLIVANTLRTVANKHLSEMLLYIIPLQNHKHPKKVFLCLPFAGVVAGVKLEFNYDNTLIAVCIVLLVWLSNGSTIKKTTKISKNQSYSKTWNNPSDSLIISHNDQFHLIVTNKGKMISGNEDIKSCQALMIQQQFNRQLMKQSFQKSINKQKKEKC